MLLNVITSCIRPQNLLPILESIKKSKASFQVIWHIVLDNHVLKYSLEDVENLKNTLPAEDITLNFYLFTDSYLQNWPTNLALDAITQGLVCVIDDDNIMHPDYGRVISSIAENKSEIGILYSQLLDCKPRTYNLPIRKIVPYLVLPSHVDTAQITISRSLIGNSRWRPVHPDDIIYQILYKKDLNPRGKPFEPDGHFISEVYQKHTNKFIILDQPLCYYNYLKLN